MNHTADTLAGATLGIGWVAWNWFPSDLQGWALLFSTIMAGLYYYSMWRKNRRKNKD